MRPPGSLWLQEGDGRRGWSSTPPWISGRIRIGGGKLDPILLPVEGLDPALLPLERGYGEAGSHLVTPGGTRSHPAPHRGFYGGAGFYSAAHGWGWIPVPWFMEGLDPILPLLREVWKGWIPSCSLWRCWIPPCFPFGGAGSHPVLLEGFHGGAGSHPAPSKKVKSHPASLLEGGLEGLDHILLPMERLDANLSLLRGVWKDWIPPCSLRRGRNPPCFPFWEGLEGLDAILLPMEGVWKGWIPPSAG